MDGIAKLTGAQCILLAASLASESNLQSLKTLVLSQRDVFALELVFRILLTFLPETLDPTVYTGFLSDIAAPQDPSSAEDAQINLDAIKDISEQEARKRVRKLHLLPLEYPLLPEGAIEDRLGNFIVHRVHRIDAETGLLDLAQSLVPPFLDRSEYLRTWYITSVLPLLRLNYEYYTQDGLKTSLEAFEQLQGSLGVNTLLTMAKNQALQETGDATFIGRDLRGLVAPWVYGSNQRKRRRVVAGVDVSPRLETPKELHFTHESVAAEKADILTDWEHTFNWIFKTGMTHFSVAVNAIDQWDGPADADFGGYGGAHEFFTNDSDLMLDLRRQYCQNIFALVYAADQDSAEAIEGAHSILARLADLLGFVPPPELATSIYLLPRIDDHASSLEAFPKLLLDEEELLKPNHPLTKPTLPAYSILQMFVYSAYLLAGLQDTVSILQMVKLRFWSDSEDQFRLLQRILHNLLKGSKKDDDQWIRSRDIIIWLWSWGMLNHPDPAKSGYGIFGKVERARLEKEILKTLLLSTRLDLVTKLYINSSSPPLPQDEVEQVILSQIYDYYDNATNGNKTRGGMKKALDLVLAFTTHFPESGSLRRCKNLIDATHALSFYSLTLQHGVPFQPVNIRVSEDPISLLSKVLDQNPRSYTKVDDLTNIGRNLMPARPETALSADTSTSTLSSTDSRIISMAIEAALAEDDFETAYSYTMNHLPHPSAPSQTTNPAAPTDSDLDLDTDPNTPTHPAWRAAYHAGQPPSTPQSTPPTAHRLEQRLDLLSHALNLAPSSAMPDILSTWRDTEAALLALLAAESAADAAADSASARAAGRTADIPGAFAAPDAALTLQPRRAVLGSASSAALGPSPAPHDDLAPLGLVDVVRGSWRAVNRGAFPLRGGAARQGTRLDGDAGAGAASTVLSSGSANLGDAARARKRDMVANAVAGGLASGIGWVLGAQPVAGGGGGGASASGGGSHGGVDSGGGDGGQGEEWDWDGEGEADGEGGGQRA